MVSFFQPISNSSLIKRFMEGVFELCPSLPRYKYIWDVSIVLDFLRYYPNDDLSLPVLTLKCVMFRDAKNMFFSNHLFYAKKKCFLSKKNSFLMFFLFLSITGRFLINYSAIRVYL